MWSFCIGKIWGIEVRIHSLFVALLAIIALVETAQWGIAGGILYVILMAFVFSFVLLHELGHCLVARYHNIAVRDITLWPFGGIASMDRISRNPRVEMKIAVAGPLVNLILMLIFSPLALLFTYILPQHAWFFVYLVIANLLLMSFNLLPAFPMDGGRIYRAWLARRYTYVTATRKAVKIGNIVAIFLGILGIVSAHFWLTIISLIVIMASHQELAMTEAEAIYDRHSYFFTPHASYVYPDNFR